MNDFPIPHKAPIRFVRSLLKYDSNSALVEVSFEQIPTLAMLCEAAAQASSGIKDKKQEQRIGFVLGFRNIKLLEKPNKQNYKIDINLVQQLDDFKSFDFTVLDENDPVSTGSFSLMLQ